MPNPPLNDLEYAKFDQYGNLKVALHSKDGEGINSFRNAINTHDADTHNIPINEFVNFHTGTTSTLVSPSVVGATSLDIVSAVGFVVGDGLHIHNGVYEVTTPRVLAIVNNTLTIDRPLDNAFPAGTIVDVVRTNIALANGTLSSPITYSKAPSTGDIWHIKRIIIEMSFSAAADNSKFGSIAALTNGVLLRAYSNGVYRTLTNWKRNGDIINDFYEVVYTDKAGGGLYGLSGRNLLEDIGITIRLDNSTGDMFQVIAQDNLTALSTFRVKLQGHIEGG